MISQQDGYALLKLAITLDLSSDEKRAVLDYLAMEGEKTMSNDTPPDPEPAYRPLDDHAIAAVCYEAERKIYFALGRFGMPPWESVPEGERVRRASAITDTPMPLRPDVDAILPERLVRLRILLKALLHG